MEVFAVVCPNGLGHVKRVVGLLHALDVLKPGFRAALLLPPFAERLKNWPKLQHPNWQLFPLPKGIRGVRWSSDASAYRDGSLFAWEKHLRSLPAFRRARLVLSDNLATVLAHRPDAVLSGSFLWSDVLEKAHGGEPEVRKFVELERQLLAKHKPLMLGVEALAMPSVKRQTRWKGFGFFTQGPRWPLRLPSGQTYRIAVLGGATAAARKLLLQAVRELAAGKDYQLLLPEGLLQAAQAEGIGNTALFGFRAEDFASCHLVICRPGVGTLTDCVETATPLVAVYEAGNAEMEHLGRLVEKLGLGRNAGQSPVRELVEKMLDPEQQKYHRAKLHAQTGGGLEKAALFLADFF